MFCVNQLCLVISVGWNPTFDRKDGFKCQPCKNNFLIYNKYTVGVK